MRHDVLLFEKRINEYDALAPKNSIGTIGERSLHSIIKNYYETDKSKQEVCVCGFVADILNDEGIIEIQTNNFSPLARKLEKYLDYYKVKIVYPAAHIKHIVWVDPQSGEIIKRNRSPKVGTGIEFLYEVSRLRKFINHENLSFEILLIDIDEYRLLNGWSKDGKRGSQRFERRPVSLYSVCRIDSPYDLNKILPPDFPDGEFDYKDFEKVMKIKGRTARFSMNTLLEYGAVEVVRKVKNSIIYKKIV